ncbi:hypothetical protein TRVL_10043 [Trypanosoma vivax]|nr:hypothetical protein TRVL_10043 [Trypanosoma vivax]
MGCICGPEMLHTVARVLAGDPAVVSLRYAAPKSLKIHAWIGNVRISGPRQKMGKQGRVVTQNVRQCGAALGEDNCLAKNYGLIGAPFNRETATVRLSQKAIRKFRDAPPLERLAVVELQCLTPRMVRALVVRSGALFEDVSL